MVYNSYPRVYNISIPVILSRVTHLNNHFNGIIYTKGVRNMIKKKFLHKNFPRLVVAKEGRL